MAGKDLKLPTCDGAIKGGIERLEINLHAIIRLLFRIVFLHVTAIYYHRLGNIFK